MKKIKVVLSTITLIAFLSPQLVMAAPLSGADSDVVYMYKGMMSWDNATTTTTDANNDTGNGGTVGDVHWPEMDTKHGVIGSETDKFGTIVVDVSYAITSSPQYDADLRYWSNDSNTWVPLTITSNALAFYSTGVKSIVFDIPTDWALKEVNGITGYWVSTGNLDAMGGTGDGTYGADLSQISILLQGSGGGGPAPSTPEFSDYLLLLLLGGGFWYTKNQMQGKSAKPV